MKSEYVLILSLIKVLLLNIRFRVLFEETLAISSFGAPFVSMAMILSFKMPFEVPFEEMLTI